jgi:DNA-binding XRE family transcriptional regulator
MRIGEVGPKAKKNASVSGATRKVSAGLLEPITTRGEVTRIVPKEELERLLQQAELQEMIGMLEDPNAKRVDLGNYKLRVAGSTVAAARKARGLTQVQLARQLKLPQSQISRIERNPDHTTVRTLKKIATALNVNARQLLA